MERRSCAAHCRIFGGWRCAKPVPFANLGYNSDTFRRFCSHNSEYFSLEPFNTTRKRSTMASCTTAAFTAVVLTSAFASIFCAEVDETLNQVEPDPELQSSSYPTRSPNSSPVPHGKVNSLKYVRCRTEATSLRSLADEEEDNESS